MTEKPSTWTRIKWAIVGKPVTYEEHRAAQASQFRDARVVGHAEARHQRFHAGGF